MVGAVGHFTLQRMAHTTRKFLGGGGGGEGSEINSTGQTGGSGVVVVKTE